MYHNTGMLWEYIVIIMCGLLKEYFKLYFKTIASVSYVITSKGFTLITTFTNGQWFFY